MKTAAPEAPVSTNAKNRKASGAPHSAALERGAGKGSALFQQLMSARAAAKNAGAQQVPVAEGLKDAQLLAALLKASRGASAQKLSGVKPAEALSADAAAMLDKQDAARKSARAKSLPAVVHPGQAAAHPDAQKNQVSGKEPKGDAGETSKAPVGDVKAVAVREPLIRVLDLRRPEKQHASADTASVRTADQAGSSGKDAPPPVTLRLGPPVLDTLAKPAPAAAPHSATPLERLREMAGSELVRASSLVLKDGGGEIRLVLKPESLGSVRIRMNVVDNAIEGRIIVDSAAVKHVFDGSVDALRRALTAEGFQMGSLQVSVGGQNADTGGRQQRDEAPAAVRRIAAVDFERNVPGAENVSLGDLFVNLFV